MIRSWADKRAEALYERNCPHKRLPTELQRKARTKLALINDTARLEDVSVPPGNRLEALKGDRKGQHSIRINKQWRICFRWEGKDAFDVEIIDYH